MAEPDRRMAPGEDRIVKAARTHGYEAAVLLEEVAVSEVAPDEILVRIIAAALNPLDVKLRSGAMHGFFPLAFPCTMGTDLAGTMARAT